jgi:hypothetical protein
MGFTVAVTVTLKKDKIIPIWNKVHLGLDGEKSDLINLQAQLELVKSHVNQDMNRKGLALKDVDIEIVFVERQ